MFCRIMIDPSFPITNYKTEYQLFADSVPFVIVSIQKMLASHWKHYLKNLHLCITDVYSIRNTLFRKGILLYIYLEFSEMLEFNDLSAIYNSS